MRTVQIRDTTMREGLDTPEVDFSYEQRMKIALLLEQAGVPEIEIVAPSKVNQDIEFVKLLREKINKIRTTGLVYSFHSACIEQIKLSGSFLDRFDLLMPVSYQRRPFQKDAKIKLLLDRLSFALTCNKDVGAGFPQSTQADLDFLKAICHESSLKGANRITLYDTNGGSDPFAVFDLIKSVKECTSCPVFFHGHNDCGFATANSLAAVLAGADGLDVTVNGLGDRAGNAALEQVAVFLYMRGINTGIDLKKLKKISLCVEKESRIPLSKLSPVVGDFCFMHKSPGHLENPELFEAYDPVIIGESRKII